MHIFDNNVMRWYYPECSSTGLRLVISKILVTQSFDSDAKYFENFGFGIIGHLIPISDLTSSMIETIT